MNNTRICLVVMLAACLFAPVIKAENIAMLGEEVKNNYFDKSNDGDITEAQDPAKIEYLDYETVRKPLYQARIVPHFDEGGVLQYLRVFVAFDGALGHFDRLEDIPADFPDERRTHVRKSTIRDDLLKKPLISELLNDEYDNLKEAILPITVKIGDKMVELVESDESSEKKENFIRWSTNELGNQVAVDEKLSNQSIPCATTYFEGYRLVRNGGHFEKEEEKDPKDDDPHPILETLRPLKRYYAEFSGSPYKRFSAKSYLTRRGNSEFSTMGTAKDEDNRTWRVVAVSEASFNVSGRQGELHVGFTLLMYAAKYSGCDLFGQDALEALIKLQVLRWKEDGTVERTYKSGCLPVDCQGNTYCTEYHIVSSSTLATINEYIIEGRLSAPRS